MGRPSSASAVTTHRHASFLRRAAFLGALALGGSLLSVGWNPEPAQAAIVERIVAVVGEKALLLTDLKERTLPILLRVYSQVPEGPQRAATVSQVYRSMLERMVEEELESQAAQQSGITVSTEEVNEALARVSAQNNLSINEVLVEAKRSGLTPAAYRDELRRQLLQAKMSQLRLRGRIQVTDNDIEVAYKRLATQERMQLPQRTLQLRVFVGKGAADRAQQKELAEQLAKRAQQGEDLGELIEEYATSPGSGLTPPRAPAQEPKAIQRATLALEVGQTSPPIKQGSDWVILQIVERPESELPPLEDVRDEMEQQVYMERMAEARQHWIKGLRRRTHVEIRL